MVHTTCPPEFILPPPVRLENAPPIMSGSKTIIYADKRQFEEADKHALSINRRVFKDFRELMWILIYKKNLNQLMRARVIFRWLVNPNVCKVTFERAAFNTIEEYFMSCLPQSNSSGSFSKLFQILASSAQLYCANVYGFAKGAEYTLGETFTNKEPTHMWNGICIDYRWYLIDIHWAMRYSLNRQESADFDDFFFLMDPYRAVYTHYPTEHKWQLLPHPMTLHQFEELPHIKSHFFLAGMQFESSEFGTKRCSNGELKITHPYYSISEFSFSLKFMQDGVLQDTINDIRTNSLGILETTDKRINLYFRFPKAGTYFLTIYSKVVKTFKDIEDNNLCAAVKYRIDCEKPSIVPIFPLIGFLDSGVGPCWPMMHYFELIPMTHRSGIIRVGQIAPTMVAIQLYKGSSHTRLISKIRKPNLSTAERNPNEMAYDVSLIKSQVDFDNIYTVEVNLPVYGEYLMEIYAYDGDKSINYELVCQYLLDVKKKEKHFITSILPYEAVDRCMSYLPDPYTYSYPNPDPQLDKTPITELFYNKDWTQIMGPKIEISPAVTENLFDLNMDEICAATYYDINDLIHNVKSTFSSPRDIVRAFFTWLCSCQWEKVQFAENTNAAEDAIMTLKADDIGYADAFCKLCRIANIRCVSIEGYAKGANFKSCEPICDEKPETNLTHTWNAVLLGDTWYFVDCQWAARRYVRVNGSFGDLVYGLDEYYFMTKPEEFNKTHFPHDPHWQLTSDVISLQDFTDTPPMGRSFFKYNMNLKTHPKGLLEAVDEVIIEVEYENNPDNIAFSALFNIEGTNDFFNTHVNCLQYIDDISCIAKYTVRIPQTSMYILTLLVKTPQDSTFDSFAEYRISGVTTKEVKPFPHKPDSPAYGLTSLAYKMGVRARHGSELFYAKDVEKLLQVEYYQLDNKMPQLHATMRTLKSNEEANRNYVVQKQLATPVLQYKVLFDFHFPTEDEYAIQIYQLCDKEHDMDFNDCILVAQYLVTVSKACFEEPHEYCEYSPLGMTQLFIDLNLRTLSHPDPFIEVPLPTEVEDAGGLCWPDSDFAIEQLIADFSTDDEYPMTVIPQLSMHGDKQIEVDNYVLPQVYRNRLQYLLRFPKPGHYVLSLYGRLTKDESSIAKLLYTYKIRVPVRSEDLHCSYIGLTDGPFPQQSLLWMQGSFLISPKNGILYKNRQSSSLVTFSVKLPRAYDVALLVDDRITNLMLVGSEKLIDTWEAEIELPDINDKRISLCGRWSSDDHKMPALLEFTVNYREDGK